MFALESKKKNVVQTFCPTTVGISSDIGKLWSVNVQSLTVIFHPESTILWNPHILCMNMHDENQAQGWSMDQVHESGPWTGSMRWSMDQVHGPTGWSMDRVHGGGPWTWVHVLYTSFILCVFEDTWDLNGFVSFWPV